MGTLLCAIDDTPEAEEALRVAARLSRAVDLRLLVVHVEDTVGAGSDVRASAPKVGRQLLDRMLAAQGLNGSIDRRVETGRPSSEIARVAAEEAATLIVIGSRTRHWWRRIATSQLAEELAAIASCPVAVVPTVARH